MKFKLKYIFALYIVLLAVSSFAQHGKQDKVEALKVSFITQKINLSPQEAQSFWPVYNEYSDKIKFARRNFRTQYGNATEFKTDKDADDYLSAELKLKQAELELHKEYFEKFKKLIGAKKTALLRLAEEEFKKEIIKTIKGNGNDS